MTELCMVLIIAGVLSSPMPIVISINVIIEGIKEPLTIFLDTLEEKENMRHIICPEDFI